MIRVMIRVSSLSQPIHCNYLSLMNQQRLAPALRTSNSYRKFSVRPRIVKHTLKMLEMPFQRPKIQKTCPRTPLEMCRHFSVTPLLFIKAGSASGNDENLRTSSASKNLLYHADFNVFSDILQTEEGRDVEEVEQVKVHKN